ncbi:MAG: 50S ribosomal protein L11 methyltransferase [Ruminococcus sp.]|nr:50S ribosomal protein L11 methyltransferase [Ruminococcus sp.]
MEWREIEVFTTKEGLEPLTGALNLLGINGFVINDADEFKAFTEDKSANWDYIDDSLLKLKERENSVTCYLPDNAQGEQMLIELKAELAAMKSRDAEGRLGRLEIREASVKEEDWANNWKQYFHPFPVGQNLLVMPSWETLDVPTPRQIILIDPESSFGTGQHDTTRMCLDMLDGRVCEGDLMLDLGCGSGILSVASAKLGAKKVTCVDIDENSVKIARQNLEKNSIPADRFEVMCGNICEDAALRERIGSGYDVVCANIVADVLIAMSDYFMSFLNDNGVLIVSGIIKQRADEVFSVLKQKGFVMVGIREREDWVAAMYATPNNKDIHN